MVKDNKQLEFENQEDENKCKDIKKVSKQELLIKKRKARFILKTSKMRIKRDQKKRNERENWISLIDSQNIDGKIANIEEPKVLVIYKTIKIPFYLSKQIFEKRAFMLYPVGLNRYVFYSQKVQPGVVHLLQEQNGETRILVSVKFMEKREINKIMVLSKDHVLIILKSLNKKNVIFYDWEMKNGSYEKIFDGCCKFQYGLKENLNDQFIGKKNAYFGRIYVFSQTSICCFIWASNNSHFFKFSRILEDQRLDFKWRVFRSLNKISGNIIKVNCHSKIAHSFLVSGGYYSFKFLFLTQEIMANNKFNTYEIESVQVHVDLDILCKVLDTQMRGDGCHFEIMNILEIGLNVYYLKFSIWGEQVQKRENLLCLIEFKEENGYLISNKLTRINKYFQTEKCLLQFCQGNRVSYENCQMGNIKNMPIFYVNNLTNQIFNKQRQDSDSFYYFSKYDKWMKYGFKLRNCSKEQKVSQFEVKRMKSGVYLPFSYFFFIEEWMKNCDEDILYQVARLFGANYSISF